MHPYPSLQPLESTPDVLDGGHLWLQEYLTGPILGFEMDETGLLTFGVDGTEFDTAPPSVRRAVGHVRQSVDRDRLRSGVDDVATFVFFGVATRYEGLEYDWDALPPFVGLDIWAESEGRFVTPDVAERVFNAIGLTPVPAFEKEVPASHFDPNSFDIPTSHWRDGRAAGVVVRNKSGGAAVVERTAAFADASAVSNESVAIEAAVACGFTDALAAMDATVETVDVDALSDSLFERVARVAYHDIADGLDRRPDAVRSDVGSAVRSILREERSVSKEF
ncbi:MAG: hypothetical protein ACOCUO_00035 [archaeon]